MTLSRDVQRCIYNIVTSYDGESDASEAVSSEENRLKRPESFEDLHSVK